ncbi:hypothetical protein HanOQP8_Chr17g0676901 [Helianthus annuus]|nr:hypothetical protein HanOQP8_Chr17g0676901 [Helianthus annuus]
MVPRIHHLLAVLGGASMWRVKKRGKAKNKGLRQAIALNKGPVSLSFDTEVTYSPIGTPNDWFTREVGSYMFGHFAFDKSSYNYVSDAEKNAMEVHLRDKTRLEAFKNGHTLKDGRFATELEEQKYEELQAEFESRSEPNVEEFGEGSSSQVNEVQVFEKVFGARRGHYIGMGRKPSLSRFTPPICVGPHEKEQTPPALTEVKLDHL